MIQVFSRFLKFFIVIAILAVTLVGVFNFYSFLFSRKVKGVIEAIERVDINVALMQAQSGPVNPQLFSFSVAIREANGEIVTASAEDRQWAVAKKGQCAEAVYYPYPPWNLMKAGTYFNARLDKLSDCNGHQ